MTSIRTICIINVQKFKKKITNKPLFLYVCSTSLLRILWKRRNNELFLPFLSCFYPSGELSVTFPNKPWFLLHVPAVQVLRKHCEKIEELLATSNFSFSHCVFHLYGDLSAVFIKFEIVVCKLYLFGRV